MRRVLWRAFQRGGLSEEEFASTLERLEFESRTLDPGPGLAAAAEVETSSI